MQRINNFVNIKNDQLILNVFDALSMLQKINLSFKILIYTKFKFVELSYLMPKLEISLKYHT